MSLFKYMHENRIENILIKNKIRFTQPIYFNDPFEVKLSIKGFASKLKLSKQHDENFESIVQDLYNKEYSYLKSQIKYEQFLSMINKDEGLNDFLKVSNDKIIHKILMNKFDEVICNILGILSLTTKNDNLLMWSHYSNNHEGFVIEFNDKDTFFEPLDKENYIYNGLQKVKYSNDRPYKYLDDYHFNEILLTKSEHWAYEDEYRIIKRLEDADAKIGDVFLFEFPKNMIKSIYCGCSMKLENKKNILDLIESNKELNHIKLFHSKISDRYYKLDFEQVR